MEPKFVKRNKVWHVRYKAPSGQKTTVSTGCTEKAEARVWAAEFLRELDSPTKIVLVADLLDAWERKKMEEGGDVVKIQSNLRRLRAAFGACSPFDIQDTLDAYVEGRLKEVSERSIGRELGDLRAALNWGAHPKSGRDKKPLLTEPPAKIWFDNKVTKRTRVASEEELKKLSEAMKGEEFWVKMAFYLAISTAQRKQAVLDLTVDRVRWDVGHMDFKNPNLTGWRKGRSTVLIPEELKPLLKQACEESKSGYVVEKNGRPVKAPTLYYRWSLMKARAGVENLWWHDLRRTWATLAARDRVDMLQISRQLGHSSLKMTEEHYAQFHPDYMGEAQNHSGRMLQNFL